MTAAGAPPSPAPGFEPVTVADEPDEPEPPRVVSPSGKDDPTRPLQERFRAAVESVRAASTRHGASLANGRVLWIRNGEVSVAFTKAAEFHRTVIAGMGRNVVEKALSEHFGRPTKLTIDVNPGVADAAQKSIAEEENAARQERERGADKQVRTHPAILSTLKILGGEIEHIQVLEPERPAVTAAAPDDAPTDN